MKQRNFEDAGAILLGAFAFYVGGLPAALVCAACFVFVSAWLDEWEKRL